jgi:hypothetical protein
MFRQFSRRCISQFYLYSLILLSSGSLLQTPWINKYLYVKQQSSLITMIQGFGFEVAFDTNGRLYIMLEPYYIAKVSTHLSGTFRPMISTLRGLKHHPSIHLSISSIPSTTYRASTTSSIIHHSGLNIFYS